MTESLSRNLAHNIRSLRERAGLSQQQIAQVADIPRPTWANLESGDANPTVSVLTKVAAALGVGVDQLLANAEEPSRVLTVEQLPVHKRGKVTIRSLTVERLVGLGLERWTFSVGGVVTGSRHPPNSREVFTCESGDLEVSIGQVTHRIKSGDVLISTSEQKSTYRNVGRTKAVAYSIVSIRNQDAKLAGA